MNKLKLDIEELSVEQFSTEVADQQVKGDDSSKWWSGCNVSTCYC